MKNVIKALVFGTSLMISTQALSAQESYGLPGGGSHGRAGGSVWHQYNCSVPSYKGSMMLGVRYSLQIATAALSPEYNVTGCSLKTAAVVPNPIWSEIPLNKLSQDTDMAIFGNDRIKVVVEKENYTARIEFSNGAVSNCVVK
jgi:hypothetical protein